MLSMTSFFGVGKGNYDRFGCESLSLFEFVLFWGKGNQKETEGHVGSCIGVVLLVVLGCCLFFVLCSEVSRMGLSSLVGGLDWRLGMCAGSCRR